MSKTKGTRAERELLHLFWNTKEWAALRCPGSGSTPLPSPDILASNKKRILAIECKSIKNTTKYFQKEEIKQLKKFSDKFGAEPWIGIRFDKIGWFFINAEKIKNTNKKMIPISLKLCQKKALSFEKLIGKFE